MCYFVNVCLVEMEKQMKNYYKVYSAFISLFLWPILTFLITYYTYLSFDWDKISQMGFKSREELFDFLVIGILVYSSFFSMVQGAFQIINERESGTIEMIYLTPANRMAMLYGRALGGLIQNIWMLLLFCLYIIIHENGISFYILCRLLLGYLFLILSATIWGGFINAFYLITRDANIFFYICDTPMNFFSGVKIPIQMFPIWARNIAKIFPLTYCMNIVRGIIIQSTQGNYLHSFSGVLISNCIMITVTYFISLFSEKINEMT